MIKRLKSKPKDFTFEEAETLLNFFDYVRSDKERTSCLRVIFTNKNKASILLHKPHPQKELLAYNVKQLIEVLSQKGLL